MPRVHTHTAYCFEPGCRKIHTIYDNADYWGDWKQKHLRCKAVGILPAAFLRTKEFADTLRHNADVKEAFQGEQTMTVTTLNSGLGNSATAGWCSASVDNSANLYLDSLVTITIAAVNTAPGSDKCLYVFAYGSNNGTVFTGTGTSGGTVGTEGTLTFPSISTLPILMPRLGVIPYPVQNKALDAGPFSVARAFGGRLPPYWGVAILPFAGFTLAGAGNTVKYRGLYSTVS